MSKRRNRRRGRRAQILGVNVAEREDDLDKQRQQAKPCAAPPPRSPPIHVPRARPSVPKRSPFVGEAVGMLRLFCGSGEERLGRACRRFINPPVRRAVTESERGDDRDAAEFLTQAGPAVQMCAAPSSGRAPPMQYYFLLQLRNFYCNPDAAARGGKMILLVSCPALKQRKCF
ncbi:MAG TPA: hypothetical protein VII40_05785 [Xanthobacteraceae bacterium]